jgi:dienelactone hydrolase
MPSRLVAPPLAAAALLVAAACTQPLKLSRDDSPRVLTQQTLRASDPADRGPLPVRLMYYGSGTDKRRAAFRDSVQIRTKTVDASPFVSSSPEIAKSRQKYWGFDYKKFPLNARVWMPQGEGPFPLALIVHGNHDMRDFSDPGYQYLGELLASRGIILASVDMNFINGGLGGENDGRGWLLLKHLEMWRKWNDSTGSPFHRKVDMRNLALMGHSRGGEAVAVAGAFNRLKHYPDDANVKFDFGFDLRALVAIAPVDGQYRPSNKPTPVENVNYLVFHGSHDGDVSTFHGLRQYQRVKFTDGRPWFKSAVYVYRANHGQWNSVWQNKDRGPRSARSLNLETLMPEADQRRFGELYISAFLEATLKGKREYLPLFRDHRVAGEWLPKTMYITRFEESGFRALADFEEDVDLTTGSVRGVSIQGDSLSGWKEGVIPYRAFNSDMGTYGAWVGWNNKPAGKDTTMPRTPATYTITLTDSLRSAWNVGPASALVLSLAPTTATPGPRKVDPDTTKAKGDSAKADSTKKATTKKPAAKPPAPKKEPADTTPFDLSVELVDASGKAARLPLSRYGAPRRPLDVFISRRKGRDKSNFQSTHELVLQTYVIPVRDFSAAESGFDATKVRAVRLRFDRTRIGQVVLDDVGFSGIDPAFLAGGR